MGTSLIRAMLLASAGVAVAVVGAPTAAYAQEATYQIDIPAQSMGDALRALGKATKQNIVFNGSLVRGKRSAAVRGRMAASEALAQMLSGSGLQMGRGSGGGFTVVKGGNGQVADNASSRGGDQAEDAAGAGEGVEPEIVVTGTNIRGVINPTIPIQKYGRQQIENRGFSTTPDFIRSIPQNFKGGSAGASEEGFLNGQSGLTNYTSASAPNLRGLGSNSTLVLLNGHRLAGGTTGTIVDISLIPLEALERVDVLPDGAAAVYGADAVGGVVNFILRRDFEGAETTLRFDTVTKGSRQQLTLGQAVGANWSSGNILGSFQYVQADRLPSDERSATSAVPTPTDIFPQVRRFEGLVSVRQSLSPDLEIFADVLGSSQRQERRTTDTNQQQDNRVRSEFWSVNGGIRWRPTSEWTIEANGLYSSSDTTLRVFFTPPSAAGYVNGTINTINNASLYEGNLKADGTLFNLPGGEVRLAIGGTYRHESGGETIPYIPAGGSYGRNAYAAFSEVLVPVVGRGNAVPGIAELTVSGAIRYDHYSDFGSTTNPKIGVSYAPIEGLRFRGSFGTSFRAPNGSELNGAGTTPFVLGFPGFAQPDGVARPTLVRVGGGVDLVPEEAEIWSVGFDFRPQFASGLRITGNFYDIDYRNRIIRPPFNTSALINPDVFGTLITRFANPAEAQAYVNNIIALGGTFTDFTGAGVGAARYAYSLSITNASVVKQRGADLAIQYIWTRGADTFNLGVEAAIIDRIRTAFCDTCATTDLVDTFGQPLNLRLRAQAGWTGRNLSVNLAATYADDYRDTSAVPPQPIDSWLTFDLNARYAPPAIPGLSLGISVTNLFDADPPRTASGFNRIRYDSANADVIGRVVSFQLRKTW